MSHNITVEGGTSLRLLTAGKYCDRDIEVTATGGTEDLDTVLTEQESLIDELKAVLAEKASGGDSLADRLNGTLKTYSSEEAVAVPNYAFRGLKSLASFDCPNVTSIGEYAFYSCSALLELNCPKVTSIGTYSLYGSGVVDVCFPELLSVPTYAIAYCPNITSLNLPKVTEIANMGCRQNGKLSRVDLGSATTLGNSAFYYSSVDTLIVRTNSVCTLSTATGLQGSEIASKKGYIYVPSALVEEYKAATNWSAYASQFRAIEDYPEICGEVTA